MRFDVVVDVRLRGGIADPAGATIERALPALGYEGVTEVSVGKTVRFTIEAADATEATRSTCTLDNRSNAVHQLIAGIDIYAGIFIVDSFLS